MSEEAVNYEDKASKMGWVPQEEWKGDPEKWRPAEEFVERGEKIVPILKERIDKLESDLRVATSMTKAELERVKTEQYEKAKGEYEEKLRKLQEKEFEAFQTGDAEAFKNAKKEMSSIKPPPQPVSSAAQPDPVFIDWSTKNSWYTNDVELQDLADHIGHKIKDAYIGRNPTEFYDEVAKRVKKARPDKFTNPKRETANDVEGGTNNAGSKKNGKSFNDLPDSAKKQYTRLAKKFEMQGRKADKEAFATAYFEQ